MRGLLRKIEPLGWEFDGYEGSGHIRLHHPQTGHRYTCAATPSDYRGERNMLAALERLAGRRLARPNAGKYRHKPGEEPQRRQPKGLSQTEIDERRAGKWRRDREAERRLIEAERHRKDIEALMMPGRTT